jgi:hypothetical protein
LKPVRKSAYKLRLLTPQIRLLTPQIRLLTPQIRSKSSRLPKIF